MTKGPGIARTPLPKGFTAGGVNSGLRKYRPDVGMILSDRDCVAAGVFTLNECKAAPVVFSQALVPGKNIRAIVTNSGQANAATGEEGTRRNLRLVNAAAQAVGLFPNQVLVASTGVIGHQLDIEKLEAGMPALAASLGTNAEPFALAILTTDLVPKTLTTTLKLSQGEIRITGISKGSGMIHPNMATMLGYLLTDCAVPASLARDLLKDVNQKSFNMISVDGDTSTNDCAFFLANGASGVEIKTDEDFRLFKTTLTSVAQELAKAIARDGEGADRLIEVTVRNCPSQALAERAARGITVSPLIKSAMHGADPNWGRILARLGAEQVPAAALARMKLEIQGVTLFEAGAPAPFNRDEVRALLKAETVQVNIDLRSGEACATAWGCDLSKRYVEINTEYN
ncbi:MAG: bifunctional glutamate N-acetyltransferase/amino-acid acetyltransferase ArgJ [Bdellovibrionota bacterium]